MERALHWFVIVLAWVGAIALLGAIGWGGFYLAFRNFAGGNCTDTEQRIALSPDGIHSVKSFHRNCGGQFDGFFVYLSIGNPNKGYEYTPIVEIQNVSAGQVSVRWKGPNELDVDYPGSAKVVDAYATIFNVRVVLNPPI